MSSRFRRAWTLVGVGAALVLLLGGYFWLTRPKPAPASTRRQGGAVPGRQGKLAWSRSS